MTLKEWKARFHVGMQLHCTYRHYWYSAKPKPLTDEIITIRKVGASYVCYDGPTLNLKPGQLAWMHFPKASELKSTDNGFELYFPVDPALSNPVMGPERSGKLMSRYEYTGGAA